MEYEQYGKETYQILRRYFFVTIIHDEWLYDVILTSYGRADKEFET